MTTEPGAEAAPARKPEDAIAHIREVSENARTTWFGLLALLAFIGVTLMAHRDADFFARDVQTALPLIGIEVPTVAFFIAAPLILAAVYAYLHLYLITLWDALAEAPARPGGQPLSGQIYPWLLAQAAVRLRAHMRGDGASQTRALDGITGAISFAITWAFGLLALGRMWTESWALHEPRLSLWIAACLFAAGLVGVRSYVTMRRLMRGTPHRAAHAMPPWLPVTGTLAAVALAYVSWQTTHGGFPLSLERSWTERRSTWITRGADLREAELIPRPADYLPYERWFSAANPQLREDLRLTGTTRLPASHYGIYWKRIRDGWENQLDGLPSAELRQADLRGARMLRAFLPRGDLRGAYLQGADLTQADLRRAELGCWDPDAQRDDDEICADLRGARMRSTLAQGADFRRALMAGVDLYAARLQGASLRAADLSGAELRRAFLHGADLSGARLDAVSAVGANFDGAIAHGASLRRAVLRSADLRGARLSRTDLSGADLRKAKLDYANLGQTKLHGATLHGTALKSVTLRGTRLDAADLRGSTITSDDCGGATFYAAALHGASIDCDLTPASVAMAVGDETTRLPRGIRIMSCLPRSSPRLEELLRLHPVVADDPRLGRKAFRALILCRDGERPRRLQPSPP